MTIDNEKGFTLIELLIAITILTVGLLAVASMQATSLRGDSFAYKKTEASTWAQDKLESLMADPFVGSTVGNENRENYNIEWKIEPIPGVAHASSITIDVKQNGQKVIKSLVTKRSEMFF
jgi:type IV pilus modification protein PilV